VKIDDLIALLADAGLEIVESGGTGVGSLVFVLGLRTT
jgi:hypothetical protein